MPTTQPFSKAAFAAVDPIMQRIYSHPFNAELIQGTLPLDKFLYYMQQDSLYLIAYGRALAIAGAKLQEPEDIALGLYFAEQGMLAERELHDFYFHEYGLSPTNNAAPTCHAYTSHLLERAALGSPAEGMAALLPCFWIYREVGNYILAKAATPNPYAKWIESYSSEEYSLVVDKAVALTDKLALQAGEAERERMMQGFITSSRYEYLFWDAAYALQQWAV